MFKNLSVRSKLLTIVATIGMLFGATMFALEFVASQHVVGSLQSETDRANKVIREFVDSRFRQLNAGLNSLVDSPEIRAVLTSDGVDHDTQLMSITDLQHILGADVVLYCNEKGRTLARTDDPFDTESQVDSHPIIGKALHGESCRGFWDVNQQVLLAIAFPVTIEGEVRGVVCAGVDFAKDSQTLASLLLRDVVLTRNKTVIASSIPSEFTKVVCDQLEDFTSVTTTAVNSIKNVKQLPMVDCRWQEAEESNCLATNLQVQTSGAETLLATVLIPGRSVFGFYDDFLKVLIALGATTIGLSSLIVYRIGASISRNVKDTLVTLEKVASGDLTARLLIQGSDEFGRIAQSLNTAIAASESNVQALSIRNRDTRMLLDAVEQGFFTIGSDGVMSEERSGAVDRMLGSPKPGMTLVEFLSQFDGKAADWLALGLDDVFRDIMPIEVTIDQLPKRFSHAEKTFALEFTPVVVEGKLSKLAVVIGDITAQVENEKLEARQRQMMAMVHRMAEDRNGFLEFVHEAREIVAALKDISNPSLSVTKRRVHTLKGNASIFGLVKIADICHRIEDFIAENNELPEETQWSELTEAWEDIEYSLSQILGDQTQGIEVSEQQLDRAIEMVLRRVDHSSLAVELASWKLEATAIRLRRLAEQARSLAKRLGKGDIQLITEDHGICLENEIWSEFWSSFVHVLRNAIDHGLEHEEERLQRGKSGAGKIRLETRLENDRLLVCIEDDGRGIDWEKLTEAAYRKGLPAETREDLVEALFHEGVSTADHVTDISGRGVGMSAIKDACSRLGGTIRIHSSEGVGTRIEINFPANQLAPATKKLLEDYDVERADRVFAPNAVTSNGQSNQSTPSLTPA